MSKTTRREVDEILSFRYSGFRKGVQMCESLQRTAALSSRFAAQCGYPQQKPEYRNERCKTTRQRDDESIPPRVE